MDFLNRLRAGSKSTPRNVEQTIQVDYWKAVSCKVAKTIKWTGYAPKPQAMRFEFTCKWSATGHPLLFLSLVFDPNLSADDGYLAARLQNGVDDSGMCVVRLTQLAQGMTLISHFERDDVIKFLDVLKAGKQMELWLGNEDDSLLMLPVPPKNGLEQAIEQASNHPQSREH